MVNRDFDENGKPCNAIELSSVADDYVEVHERNIFFSSMTPEMRSEFGF